jgi:N-acetyl-gamma-glutamyl-phosphate reductase
MRVAVVGASGYTGLELIRILLRHPIFELVAVTSQQRAGQPVGEAFPALRGQLELAFEAAEADGLASKIDLAFTALPHATSASSVGALRGAGVPVVDLSADFRLRSLETYRAWYGEHLAPDLVASAVYGLPELHREALRAAELVAVPGCYPTSALLPLVPFLRAGLIETSGIAVDSKSGVSGAGRKLEAGYLFAELDENCMAYKVGEHRHGPEIEQEASAAAGEEVRLTFVPHLVPVTRGIATSVYARPRRPRRRPSWRPCAVPTSATSPRSPTRETGPWSCSPPSTTWSRGRAARRSSARISCAACRKSWGCSTRLCFRNGVLSACLTARRGHDS